MVKLQFRVGVTGDTGVDIYTQYVSGYVSSDDRVSSPEAAYDAEVPAGAHFTSIALKKLFEKPEKPGNAKPKITRSSGKGIKVDYIRPLWNGPGPLLTLHKYLVQMDEYKVTRCDEKARTLLRVKHAWPICDKHQPADSKAFYSLVTDKGGKETRPEIKKIDLLVIYDGGGRWRQYPHEQAGKTAPNTVDAMNLVNTVLGPVIKKGGSRFCSDTFPPRIIIDLNDLPEVVQSASSQTPRFAEKMTVWNALHEHREKVCVVCSVNAFRRKGAAISRRLSWEQAIEDLAADLHLFDELKALSQFHHVIVRFGLVAAAHIIRQDDDTVVADFIFAPTAKGGYYRDRIEDGNLRGENVMLIAALTRMMADCSESGKTANRENFKDAIKTGLSASMSAFDQGYTIAWENTQKSTLADGEAVICDLLKDRVGEVLTKGYQKMVVKDGGTTLGDVEIPRSILARPSSSSEKFSSDWEIFRTTINLNQPDEVQDSEKGRHNYELRRMNIASAIVLFGHQSVLNRDWTMPAKSAEQTRQKEAIRRVLERPPCRCIPSDAYDYAVLDGQKPKLPLEGVEIPSDDDDLKMTPIYVPIKTFGKLQVVERGEIESLQSIRNLIKNYLEENERSEKSSSPISVAVFGPPGAGKSFAVKQIAEEINSTLHDPAKGLEAIEYNVAQFRSSEDVGEAITRASVVNNEGKVPLVFFDEFDCALGSDPLGWLKFFLSPMQDGTFYGPKQTIKITRAIFVFAGGVNSSFEAFCGLPSPESSGANSETKRNPGVFKDQKGPDFVSRLRGHINVLPINPFRKDKTGSLKKPFIRRAIILRGLIERRKLTRRERGLDIAQIDEDVVYALLAIRHYRHGTRSMEAVLQMCTLMEKRIEKTSLPSQAQLNMHVDAEEFYILMYRGRARPSTPESKKTGELVALNNEHDNKWQESGSQGETVASPLRTLAEKQAAQPVTDAPKGEPVNQE